MAGLEDGSIAVIEVGTDPVVVKTTKAHAHRVTALEFSPAQADLVASAGDDNVVLVTSTRTWETAYRSERHADYVRGLAWHPTDPGLLVSGGWDRKILKHAIKL